MIAPGDEVPGAAARGAADVATAQKLARGGRVTEAVLLLEKVAAAHPSVVHDCNLSLAYLRARRLTEAQLVWDVSQQRKATPPDWCGPSLSAQLAGALRDEHYVPVAVQVKPANAVLDIMLGARVIVRVRELPFVWLPPGTYTVVARDGDASAQQVVAVAPPTAIVELDVHRPDPVPVSTPDAGVAVAPPIDAGVEEAPIDAAVAPLPELPPPPPPRAKWPAYAGVGVGVVGVGAGALFHAKALGTKDRANDLTAGSAAFRAERDRFGTQRAIAIAGYGVGAAALGFAAVWLFTAPDEQRAPQLGVIIGDGGATFTLEGSLP